MLSTNVKQVARVFPRKTNASPIDSMAFFRSPEKCVLPVHIDEIHVSVAFSYDKGRAEELADKWSKVAPVSIGGPAYGNPGGEFEAGKYLKHGYVITSRGCPNKCWFCEVWKREGAIRELPITNGWNLLDSNLLACSKTHVQNVFAMLSEQRSNIHLSGGLEAARLSNEHVNMLWDLRPSQIFFAYDTKDDLEPLVEAGVKLRYANFTRSHLRCYVLIGWVGDTIAAAETRLLQAWKAGFLPMAMLWRGVSDNLQRDWRSFQRVWARPAATKKYMRDNHAIY